MNLFQRIGRMMFDGDVLQTMFGVEKGSETPPKVDG